MTKKFVLGVIDHSSYRNTSRQCIYISARQYVILYFFTTSTAHKSPQIGHRKTHSRNPSTFQLAIPFIIRMILLWFLSIPHKLFPVLICLEIISPNYHTIQNSHWNWDKCAEIQEMMDSYGNNIQISLCLSERKVSVCVEKKLRDDFWKV